VGSKRVGNRPLRPNDRDAPRTSPEDVPASASGADEARSSPGISGVASGARRDPADRAGHSRDMTAGDVLDCGLEFVRRHPALGTVAAGVLGFLLGRATRR